MDKKTSQQEAAKKYVGIAAIAIAVIAIALIMWLAGVPLVRFASGARKIPSVGRQ